MTIKVFVDGTYETDIGSGQKQLHDYEFTFELPRFKTSGLETHLIRRFIPMAIAENKKMATCSRIKNIHISDVKEIDDKCSIANKNILEMSEKEIQELACLFDLYEVPLPRKMSIKALRERAFEIYSEKVLDIPLTEDKDKEQWDFYKKTPSGYKLDLDAEVPVDISKLKDENIVEEKPEKKTFADFLNKKNVITVKVSAGNQEQNNNNDDNNGNKEGGFKLPDLQNLLNK